MENEITYEAVAICEPASDEALTLDEYQRQALKTAKDGLGITYMALGLNGESGEVADKVKKVLRDNDGVFTPEKRMEIAMELGDVLWYVAATADRIGFKLSEIGKMNNKKLRSRQIRGKIGGSGDNYCRTMESECLHNRSLRRNPLAKNRT